MRRLLLVFALLAALPGLAQARERTFSYDADSDRAKALTGAGLTLTLDQGLLGGAKLELVRATAVPVAVKVAPAERKDVAPLLALLSKAAGRPDIYAVDRKADQGEVLARAFCPGASRVWLAVSPIAYGRPLTVWALGDGGVIGVTLRLCDQMDFTWRGEWALPSTRQPPSVHPLESGPGL